MLTTVIFFLVVIAVLVGMHYYIWRRLVVATLPQPRIRMIIAIIGALGAVSTFAAFMSTRSERIPEPITLLLAWIGYPWLALVAYLFIFTLFSEPIRGGFWLWQRWQVRKSDPESAGEKPDDPDRRLLLSRSLAVAIGAAAVGTVGYGMTTALGKPNIKRVAVTLKKLDPKLSGFRIGVVADIHLGPFNRRKRTIDIVQSLNELQVDVVVIAGDLMDGSVNRLGHHAEPLRDLTAKHGVFFITGNHEYYSGAPSWVEFLPTLGITVLRNERVRISENGASFELAGVDDVTAGHSGVPGHRMRIAKALRGRDTSVPVVLLAHQPIVFDEAIKHGVDLQISGHTHGGQMWPVQYLVKLQQGVVAGWSRKGDSQLYVTRGAGFWGPPVRVGAPPDITVMELRAP